MQPIVGSVLLPWSRRATIRPEHSSQWSYDNQQETDVYAGRTSLCGTAVLRLLPAIRAEPAAVSALHGAAWLFLWSAAGIRPGLTAWKRISCVRDFCLPLRSRRRGDGHAPGVAAAPAGGQGAGVRARPLLHAGELPARAHAGETVPGQRRVRRGRLEIPWPVDRRLVAGVVRDPRRLRALARLAHVAPRGSRRFAVDVADQDQRGPAAALPAGQAREAA